MNCPICNTTVDDFKRNPFCAKCHWEFIEISANASAKLKEYYTSQLDYHKKVYDLLEKGEIIKQEIKEKKTLLDKLEKEKKKACKKLEKKEEERKKEEIKYKEYNAINENINAINASITQIEISSNSIRKELQKSINYQTDLEKLREAVRIVRLWGGENLIKEVESFLANH